MDDQKKTAQCVCLFGSRRSISPPSGTIPVIPGTSASAAATPTSFLLGSPFRGRLHHHYPFSDYSIKKKNSKIRIQAQQVQRNMSMKQSSCGAQRSFPFPCHLDIRTIFFGLPGVDHVRARQETIHVSVIGIPSPPSASRTRLSTSVAPPRSRTPSSAISIARTLHRAFHGCGSIPCT